MAKRENGSEMRSGISTECSPASPACALVVCSRSTTPMIRVDCLPSVPK
jgi:hypothetical protein